MKSKLFFLFLLITLPLVLPTNEIIIVKDILTSTSIPSTTSFLLDLDYLQYTLTPSSIDLLNKSCFFTMNGFNFTLYENQGMDFDLNQNNITDWTIYIYKLTNDTIDLTLQNKELGLPIQKTNSSQTKVLAISAAIIFGVYLLLYKKEKSPRKQ